MTSEATARRLLDAGGGLVTRQELRTAGVARSWISRGIARGSLRVLHPQVLAAPDLHLDRPTQFRAALLQAGPDAALSHLSALELWGVLGDRLPRDIHVAVPRAGCRGADGVRIHYRTAGPTMTCGGLAVVTPAEAIVGATTLMDVAEVRFPAMEAVQRGLLTPGDLEFSLGIPQAARRSMRLLAEEARQGAESGGEANFWRLIEQSHLPTPVLQYEIDTYLGVKRIDAYWQDSRLGAEIDGRTVHTKALAFERDMRRQNAVHATGVVLIRFPVSQVMNDPASVLRDVEANMEARRWDLASRR